MTFDRWTAPYVRGHDSSCDVEQYPIRIAPIRYVANIMSWPLSPKLCVPLFFLLSLYTARSKWTNKPNHCLVKAKVKSEYQTYYYWWIVTHSFFGQTSEHVCSCTTIKKYNMAATCHNTYPRLYIYSVSAVVIVFTFIVRVPESRSRCRRCGTVAGYVRMQMYAQGVKANEKLEFEEEI
jgi:hypothetical protein